LTRVACLEEGLKHLRDGFDAVLLDLTLPDSRGWLSFEEVHSRDPSMAVIILTGLQDEALGMRAVKEGAQDYMVKGNFDGPLLARTIRYAIERKRTARQLQDYATELQNRNLAMAEDLKMAHEVQEAFLPRDYPVFPPGVPPESSELHFDHVYCPCDAVGGDFLNVLALGPRRAGLFICDVMGHGIRAALVTAVVRGLLEELKPVAGDPAAFLDALNRGFLHIVRRREPLIFVSALYGVVDLNRGEFCFANAGHPNPLLVRGGGDGSSWLRPEGVRGEGALGLFEHQSHMSQRAVLCPGDTLLLMTDGILDILGPDGEPFGEHGVEACVRNRVAAGETSDVLLRGVVADAQAYGTPSAIHDDICLLAAHVGGKAGPGAVQ
jgi:sigma-B regulation protein RsbU (phosphoserine phosphatase)